MKYFHVVNVSSSANFFSSNISHKCWAVYREVGSFSAEQDGRDPKVIEKDKPWPLKK